MDFSDLIRSLPTKSNWVEWLSTSQDDAAIKTFNFLSICFDNIPSIKQNKLTKRIRGSDQQEIDSIIYELVTHELLRRISLEPEWSPKIGELNPDLKFQFNRTEFIADVFVVKSPQKTIKSHGNIIESWDRPWTLSESRAQKLATRLIEKTRKYSALKQPLVLFAFLGDRHLLNSDKVEQALYGMTINEVLLEKNYPNQMENASPYPGMLIPQNGQDSLYKNLSAVIVCKWFDTANRLDEGKRLQCLILHNLLSSQKLPVDAFPNYGHVVWEKDISDNWKPSRVGDMSKVARFMGKDNIEFRPYSFASPW